MKVLNRASLTSKQLLPWNGIHPAILLSVALAGSVPVPASAQTLAFPGAEGFGRFATGGRGGAVYVVTNLNDSGPGSFRDAVSRPNRTVVFEVGGVIRIGSRVSVSPNVTIAGQTAPNGGITIYGNGVSFSGADNSITRHVRFRMGVVGSGGKDAVTISSGRNMIFDHVSVSWGRDENFSISGNVTNVTIQNCMIAQGLHPHSAGGLIQTSGGVSILRTLYVDNFTRNPKVKGVNQFVNNVVYNWGSGGAYILGDSAGLSFANVHNNYFISGPDSRAKPFIRGNLNFHIHAANNFHDANRNGVLDGSVVTREGYGVVRWQEMPYEFPAVTVMTPAEAFKVLISRAGASLNRDAVDERLIAEVTSLGTAGQIVSDERGHRLDANARASNIAPFDSDRDGMPDDWEIATGLNPNDPADGNRLNAEGYTRLEEYLNWLAAPGVIVSAGKSVDVDLAALSLGFAPYQPTYSVGPSTNGSATLIGASTARFMPKKGFTGRGGFQFVVQDADGCKVTNSVEVLTVASGS